MRLHALVLSCLLLAACRGKSDSPRRLADDEVPPRTAKPRIEVWQRPALAMPEALARFPAPALDGLVGHWVVTSDIPSQRELWIVEEQGRKLTIVDVRGRERVHGLSLHSPCSLALVDQGGRKQTRRFARLGERLLVHPEGAVALAASEGSIVACVERSTIVMPLAGACVGYDEMLGVWSELGTPAGACEREAKPDAPAEPPTLVIGEHRLHPVEGAWLDATLEAAVAERVGDRAAGLAALAKPIETTETETGATETGATETGATETGATATTTGP